MEKKSVKSYFFITLGLFINALGWTAFLIPGKIVGGGVSGIGTLLYYSINIPVGITVLIINSLLLLVSLKILGKQFGIRTIYGIIILSVFLTILQQIIKEPIIHEGFMATILGGILCGLGIGITFSNGGSTGGTDIIALMINKYKNYSPGRIILFIDVAIITSSYLIFQSLNTIVYGYVTMTVTAYVIDLFLEGSRQSVQIFIFSKKSESIADKLGKDLNRGITILKGQGWFSKNEIEPLIIITRRNELHILLREVKQIDSNSFISIAKVMGVYGRGFDRIKY